MAGMRIAVIGQGYVGLPLALSYALNGCKVTGVDSNPAVYESLASGETYQTEAYKGKTIRDILHEQLASGNYQIISDGSSAIRQAEAVILTVGIPVENGKPQTESFIAACETIGKNLRHGAVVLIRSTVVPGTTEKICIPLFEKLSGLKTGETLFVAYVPERIAEGKAFEEFQTMPTLIGAPDTASLEKAAAVIQINSRANIITSLSTISVETSKVLENLQRDANIAISQEFARFAEAAGMNAAEVIRMANTHSRVNMMFPGPGVGGYCIPNAYHYLAEKAGELDVRLPILKLSREQNEKLPRFFAEKTESLLVQAGKKIQDAKIAVVGLAMKDFSPDDRLSPSVEICELLNAKRAVVAAYDKNVTRPYPYKVAEFEQAVKDADALLILNRIEPGFNPQAAISMMKARPVIIDTRELICPSQLPKDAIFWQI